MLIYVAVCTATILFYVIGIGLIYPSSVSPDEYIVVNYHGLNDEKIVPHNENYYNGILKNIKSEEARYEMSSWDTQNTLDNVSVTYEYKIKYSVQTSEVEKFHNRYQGDRWRIRNDAVDCVSGFLESKIKNRSTKELLVNEWLFSKGINCNNVREIRISTLTANEVIWKPERIDIQSNFTES